MVRMAISSTIHTTDNRRGSSHLRIYYLLSTIAFVVGLLPRPTSSYNDPINEFITHEVVEPRVLTVHRAKRDANFYQDGKNYDDSILLLINAFNNTFKINLKRNDHLIPSNYFEKHHQNGSSVVDRPHQENPSHCHYQGQLLNAPGSWAAISTCNGSMSGVFSDQSELYYLFNKDVGDAHLLFRNSDLKHNNFKCGSDEININLFPRLSYKTRHKRSLKEPYSSDFKTKYVELVIVNDVKVFRDNKSDRKAVSERSQRIANIVNALYNQLNIFIALVGVVVWTEKDEITMNSDGDQTLNNFLHYRRERLIPEHPNDNAQLITGSSFDGGVVGKALKGPICTYEYSGGVNTDHSQVIGIVATTMAHELGHNFGMEHDTDKCKCADPNEKCIMAPSSSSISPKKWSSCSREYLEDAFRHGMDLCLRNRPKELVGAFCGNGFVDEGEQCDCGLPDYCDNKCCNATTCTLTVGAACASGTCCDTSTCRVYLKDAQKTCRPATNDCDLSEVCDGESEFCPEDVYVQDGTSCLNGQAHCYKGECNTLENQCKLLWGPTGEVSDVRCFLQNNKGNATGNCGFNLRNKTFKACSQQDIMCGTLHCTHRNERLEFGMESAAILSRSYINLRGKILTCRSAIVDLGLDSPNPGLAPDGAKCGAESMCVNQKCESVSAFLSKNACFQDCNHNGFCDNKARCHCFPGFAPPYCEFALPGGYFLTVALYIIFLCILPITAIGALIIYNYHDKIKTWWVIQARKAAIKSRAKQVTHRKPPRLPPNFNADSLEISSPIPIENDYEVIAIPTLPRNSLKGSIRASTKNHHAPAPPISNGECSTSQLLKPVRPAPAPPPPPPLPAAPPTPPSAANKPNLSRSSSDRKSNRSVKSVSSFKRPTDPPPRPPRTHQDSVKTSQSINKANRVNVERRSTVGTAIHPTHKTEPSHTNSTLLTKKKADSTGHKPKPVGLSGDSSATFAGATNGVDQSVQLVASLTKKFERLHQ